MNAKLWQNLDFAQLQALNLAIHNLTWAPWTPVKWQKYFNTVSNLEFTYNWTIWINYLDRANHSGTQLASTISDFDTQVRTSRLDQMASPTASVTFNSQLLTNILNPVNPQDAATKNYVDALISWRVWKDAARVATTANIALSGLLTIDWITLVGWDRILVKNQTAWAENGVYIAASWAWSRSTDADVSAEVLSGMTMNVNEGSTQANSQWTLITDGTIVLWTTSLSFIQTGWAGSYVNWTWITLTWNVFAIDTAIVPKKYSTLIWDAVSTVITITHNLWTIDIHIVVKEVSTWEMVIVPYKSLTTNTASIEFATAPWTNTYRATVIW